MSETDLYKEILENVISYLKTDIDKKSLEDIELIDDDDGGIKFYRVDSGNLDYRILIKMKFKYINTWFTKPRYIFKTTIKFESRSHSRNDGKIYEFDFHSKYEKLEAEIFEIISNKYKSDLFLKEREKDLSILKSLDKNIDKKYKREGKLDRLLEGEEDA